MRRLLTSLCAGSRHIFCCDRELYEKLSIQSGMTLFQRIDDQLGYLLEEVKRDLMDFLPPQRPKKLVYEGKRSLSPWKKSKMRKCFLFDVCFAARLPVFRRLPMIDPVRHGAVPTTEVRPETCVGVACIEAVCIPTQCQGPWTEETTHVES